MLTASSDAAKEMLPLITNKGNLRASKPKDGNAAYVWRMVGFLISSDRKMQCMPTTATFGVTVPADWKVDAPADWIAEKKAKMQPNDVEHAIGQKGSVDAYLAWWWTYAQREREYIKQVLDPIVDEIVKSVPVTARHGVNRWAKAFGI